MKTQITPFKLARYPEILSGPVRPIHWDVDPSSACDHHCRGCPYIYTGDIDPMLGIARPEMAVEKRTLLSYERFVHFLSEAAEHGGKAITFVGGGEPTLHPRFTGMMSAALAFGFKFGVVTHLGRRYDDAFFSTLARATWVRVSVNAGTAETYLKHQGKDDFHRVLTNMARANREGGRVGMSFLITNDNYGEIPLATQLAIDHGAQYIQFKPIIEVDLGKAYEGIEQSIEGRLLAAQDIAVHASGFEIHDQWSARLAELRDHAAKKFSGRCHVPRSNPKLGANGIVYTCCELAYSAEGAIGSIYEETLEALLEKAGARFMEQSTCPHCWNKPLNTIINEGRLSELSPPPESVDQEFV